MSNRLTKIYTRQGDKGSTTVSGRKIPKDDSLIESLGNIDELNSLIGLVISLHNKESEVNKILTLIQNQLFDLGGELYLPEHPVITAEKVAQLEEILDHWNETLPPLKEFLLPGGTPASSTCHIARTVCRRAERSIVTLNREAPLRNEEILRYVNRLSDLLFVCARMIAREDKKEEAMWDHVRK